MGAKNIMIGSSDFGVEQAALWFGRLAEYSAMDVNVWLDLRAPHAIYVMGKRRSGKTHTLGALVEGILGVDGYSSGDERQNVVILDTMNVFLTAQTPAAAFTGTELQEWGLGKPTKQAFRLLYPAGSTPPPDAVGAVPFAVPAHHLSLEDWSELFDLNPYSDPMAQLIAEAIELCVDGYSVDGTVVEPQPRYSVDDLVNCIVTADELGVFDESTRRALQRRYGAVVRSRLFTGTQLPLQMPGVATIFLLRDVEPELRRVLVSYITGRILKERSEAESIERVLATLIPSSDEATRLRGELRLATSRTWLVIDEAHNYVPATGGGTCRRRIVRYITEGRNLGLSIIVATQYPSALDPALRRNADVVLMHTLSLADDIESARGMLTTRLPMDISYDGKLIGGRESFEDLMRNLPRGYCLLSSDTVNRVCAVAVRPRVTYHGGSAY